jgi:transposase InsO family protein
MRAHQLLAPTRQGHPHGPQAHDGTIIPAQIDMMWGTDMTATYTRQEGQVAVFIAVDHDSAECMGIHAATQGTRFDALEPLRQGVRTAFGAFGQDIAQGLVLRHDHGSQYMSQVFQEELRFLGISSSPAFVREPEGNGCAERFIRTLKENLLWLTTFDTVEDLRLALHEFQRRYNETWLIGRHGYKAPAQVRHAQRCALAEAASF